MPETDARITILIVDDHTLVREGLREILGTQEDMNVVGEAADSETAIACARQSRPDIILLDIEIPGADVTDTMRELRNCSSLSRVIILSMHESPQLVQATLAAGASGYLLKHIHWEELAVAIRAIRSEPDRIILGVSRASLRHVQQEPAISALSAREREVLDLVAKAFSNGQIATRMGLTEATIKRHLRNIFVKLGATSRLDAVNKAKETTTTGSPAGT
jgi:DNA-binding NarL/FixJ family response regulator